MTKTSLPAVFMGLTAALSVAACTSSTGGGGGGATGGGTPASSAAFDTKYNQISGMVPSSTMPTSINASYTGATKQELTQPSTGARVGEMMADLELTANWTDGQAANPWSGRATNFRGDVSGTPVEVVGDLTVARAEADGFTSAIMRSPLPALPGVPAGAATGVAMVNLAGEGTDTNGDSHYVLMNLGSLTFVGSGADKAFSGNAQTQSFLNGSPIRDDLVGTGQAYIER